MILLSSLLLLYALLVLVSTGIWLKMKSENNSSEKPWVTAIVVVRNEAENIQNLLNSLKTQSYPYLEVLLVDDHSTDHTLALANEIAWEGLHILSLPQANSAPKKEGITFAIQKAKGEYIFTTDGDCTLPPRLIETYVKFIGNKHFLSGPVTFKKSNQLWENIQTVEFASLLGSAAAAMALGSPIMCSAANLFYRKQTFLEVGGYSDNLNLASGDDEFLMNKIHKSFPGSTSFVKDTNCIVETEASPTLSAFYRQRKRWAGKWNQHLNSKLTAIFIFAVNLATLALFAQGIWMPIICRFIAEALFLSSVLIFLNRRKNLLFIPLTQCVYSLYVVFFGLVSLFPGTYRWKDRTLR
jgi:cellulose synthase/poly-beta-1,6-N-acetylglucosamine synthase-like glycosyltransferase